MKLSDVKGDRVFDVIADIIDPIANIAEDENAVAMFKRERLPQGMTTKQFIIKRARKSVPVLLRSHKADIITILAAIEGVPSEEYVGVLNMVKLVHDCTELLTDDAFAELFISAQSGKEANSSGSAPESTEAQKQ